MDEATPLIDAPKTDAAPRRGLRRAAAAVLAAVLVVAATAVAVTARSPVALTSIGGSYLESCSDCSTTASAVTCWCSGNNNPTTAAIAACDGCSVYCESLENRNGVLACSSYDFGPGIGGNFAASCIGCSTGNGALTCASCRDNGGFNVGPTSAYLAGCTSFSNINGYLSCDDKDVSVVEGPFEGTCSDCSQTGTTLTCTCKKSDGTSEVTSIPLDCNCPCGERKFSNNNGELTCCCDCHAGTRVVLCPDGAPYPSYYGPVYYDDFCDLWNAPEPEAYTTECDD